MRVQTMPEKIADGTIHVIGICLGIAALITLVAVLWNTADLGRQVSVFIYAGCLLAMLICSALYNMLAKDNKTGILRKLDHAAIFLLIAGTYTPLASMIIGGWTGGILLAVIWTGALTGAILKLTPLQGIDKITVPLCLALGWVVVFAFKPLMDNASNFGFWMIIAGGLLYTVGTAFYAWKRLPFQNAIWHAFVLAAAVCHFSAVLNDVALGPVSGS
ncbi:hemolysin III family protein [Roseibium polysiphoniae]|uniref:Hemolysin III family protein n=1 Tax=Roseibium polysiphoniae TaxID=2571221 RepID=A0A944GTB5_9HYPH|nr:hemolysin III family protein [Roseibium polysiphoniae]MBD8878804.1 hemolysin III family protein [Roseibium polysiphoniae]MBS8261082.1 hemolysin III family protein [Roseibium polysiphoniae]